MKISDSLAKHLDIPIESTELDIAEAMYKKGHRIPDITPSPFGLSIFRKILLGKISEIDRDIFRMDTLKR